MWFSSSSRLVAVVVLPFLIAGPIQLVGASPIDVTSLSARAAPVEASDLVETSGQNEERGLLDALSAGKAGNLTKDIENVVADATTLLTSFVKVIRELKNATTENDLVDLLGLNIASAKQDTESVTNSTVGAVAANKTCPGMAVLFARGTTEPGTFMFISTLAHICLVIGLGMCAD